MDNPETQTRLKEAQDKQNKKHNTEKYKDEQHIPNQINNKGECRCSQRENSSINMKDCCHLRCYN